MRLRRSIDNQGPQEGAHSALYIETRSMSAEEQERKADEPPDTEKSSGEQAMLYCPVCSERLVQSRCKLVCEKCGYFMSCADYY